MKILLHLLIGYSVLCISEKDFKTLLNVANKARLRILNFKKIKDKIYFRVFTFEENKVKKLLGNHGVVFNTVARHGTPEIYKKYRNRAGLILGIVAFFLILYVSPMFIWRINISGLDKIKREDAEKLLCDAGISIGTFSPSIERSRVYSDILLNSKDISWISVNVIGSSAYVEIVEREYASASVNAADGANIVALKDGRVIDTDIKKGQRIVKDGAVVKKDELLVSGVYDTAKMGTRYVYSDAKVYAEINDTYSVKIPLRYNKKTYREEIILEKSVKIFGKSINIFKNYTQSTEKYDTIMREEGLPLACLDGLPVSMKTVCALPYEYEEDSLTEEDALKNARKEMQSLISKADYIEVLGVSERHYVKDNVLFLNCVVDAVQNIASVSEFDVK